MHKKYGLQQSTVENFITNNEKDPEVAGQLKRLQELIQNPESSFPCEIPEGGHYYVFVVRVPQLIVFCG